MGESGRESGSVGGRKGPIFDTAMRGVMEADPGAVCWLLGVQVEGSPQVLPAVFPIGKLEVDLLLRVAVDQLVHVEYVRRVDADLVHRMLGYRSVISRDHPGRLSQHVVVLGEGNVRGHEDPVGTGFWLDLNVIYLRDVEPGRLLEVPSLAPLAAMGRGSPTARAEAYAQSLRLVRKFGGSRAARLMQFTTVLATITLDSPIYLEDPRGGRNGCRNRRGTLSRHRIRSSPG
jgi:hypothetical protein